MTRRYRDADGKFLKVSKSLDINDIDRIIRMLIDMSPELDDLRNVKRGLDGYLSVFDKEKSNDERS
jgi:hypothetical protein|tara:strand:- start:610 stop:807 length:198 start_codon:yes stop_codon:yes gene_type:complete